MQLKPAILAFCTGLSITLLGAHAPPALAAGVPVQLSLPLDTLQAFSEVYSRIKQDYVDDVDDGALMDSAIRGMLDNLDPYSKYMDRAEYAERQARMSGRFGGLGVRVGEEDGRITVLEPYEDAPAYRVGVRAGDLIVRLDDHSLEGMGLGAAARLMRGEPGSDVTLTVVREHESQPLVLKLTRAVVRSRTVEHRLLEGNLGYLRISRFRPRTDEEVVAALGRLQAQAGGGLEGLVLDLRNNPGGLVSAAINIADAFLVEGEILSTYGRRHGSRSWNADADDLLAGAPLVVLVNGRSASAAEIVAGALQDHGRAVIAGRQTFGKGTVQSTLRLHEGGAIKMTTSRYFTPSGRSIHTLGITPDVVLSPSLGGVLEDAPVAGAAGGSEPFVAAESEDRALNAAIDALKARRLAGGVQS